MDRKKMNRFTSRTFLQLLILIGSTSLVSFVPAPVHAQMVGLVCIDSSSSSSCPSSVPAFSGSQGSFLTVAVNVQDSESFNGFDIRVQADPTILNGTSINLAGSVIQNPLVVNECINGFFMGGTCQPSPGVVDVILVQMNPTTAPTTGRLFAVTYHIVGTTSGTPLTYPTGCTSSSVAGTTTCVAVNNAGSVVPENVQGATFSSSGGLPDFAVTASPSSGSVPRGSSTTFSVTVTGNNGFNMTVSLVATVSPSIRHGPVATIPATAGPFSTSTLGVSTARNTPVGAYTVTVTGTSGSLSHSTSVTVTVTK